MLKGGDLKSSQKSLASLDKEFRSWAANFSKDWWATPDSTELFALTQYASTSCLNSRNYASAYLGANTLIALRQHSSLSWLYIGDVFWRLQVPFFAFDYYARAYSVGKDYGYDQNSEIRIISRLADGYEALGDLGSAVKWYKYLRINKGKELNTTDLIVYLRSNLKEAFYNELISQNKKQSTDAVLLLNEYVNVLQLSGCPTEKEIQLKTEINRALGKNDVAEFERAYKQNYEEVKSRMLNEIKGSLSFEELLLKNIKRCR